MFSGFAPNGYTFVIATVLALMAYAGVASWRRPAVPGGRAFSVLAACLVVWLFGDMTQRSAVAPSLQLLGEKIKLVGISLAPPSLLVFVLRNGGRRIPLRRSALLYAPVAASFLMLMTNDLHHLYLRVTGPGGIGRPTSTYGPWFWLVHTPYSYVLLVASASLLIADFRRAPRHFRGHIAALAAAVIVPVAMNLAYLLGVSGNRSYTALTFGALILVAWSFQRDRLFRSNPVAYETVFNTITDTIIVLDRGDVITDVNPAAARHIGAPREALVGRSAHEVFAAWPDMYARYRDLKEGREELAIRQGDRTRWLEVRITPLDGQEGREMGRVITARDITARRRQQDELERVAYLDTLTGLANRHHFEREGEGTVARAVATGGRLAVLFLDVNGLKAVNDTLGHEVGDELLRHVAQRVSSQLRRPDFVARFGGDEFLVLLHGAGERQAEAIATRLVDVTTRPFRIGERSVPAALSVGIALFPAHGDTLGSLVRVADAAMYRAKGRGGGIELGEPAERLRTPSHGFTPVTTEHPVVEG